MVTISAPFTIGHAYFTFMCLAKLAIVVCKTNMAEGVIFTEFENI